MDNLLVQNHFAIVMIRWTGLAPWESEIPLQVALHLPSRTPSPVPDAGSARTV